MMVRLAFLNDAGLYVGDTEKFPSKTADDVGGLLTSDQGFAYFRSLRDGTQLTVGDQQAVLDGSVEFFDVVEGRLVTVERSGGGDCAYVGVHKAMRSVDFLFTDFSFDGADLVWKGIHGDREMMHTGEGDFVACKPLGCYSRQLALQGVKIGSDDVFEDGSFKGGTLRLVERGNPVYEVPCQGYEHFLSEPTIVGGKPACIEALMGNEWRVIFDGEPGKIYHGPRSPALYSPPESRGTSFLRQIESAKGVVPKLWK